MILRILFLIGIVLFGILSQVFATDINLRVSPIIYKISGNPGDTITRTITVSNVDQRMYHLTTATSDFHAQGKEGQPVFVRKSELVFADQELSSWIKLPLDTFSLAPGASKKMDFTIKIPNNATPGGHYGAVFFQDHSSNTKSGTGNVGVYVDYGVLVLLTVNGDIVSSGSVDIENVQIHTSSGPGWQSPDNCPVGDLSPSPFDHACVFPLFSDPSNIPSITHSGSENSRVNFIVPFINNGNIHLAPHGKITIKDTSGNILKSIGRAIDVNEEGAIVNQSIVDYIPFNDAFGNTLPKTTREYTMSWLGFPYMTTDDKGNNTMKVQSLSEFFSEKNSREGWFLYPWQRLRESLKTENYTADFDISFTGVHNEIQNTKFSRNFQVSYPVIEKQTQPIVWILLIILIAWWAYWYFGIFSRRYTYFEYFMNTYLSKNWKKLYSTSAEAFHDYMTSENKEYQKGIMRDIAHILKKYKDESSLENFMEKQDFSYSPDMENKNYMTWLRELRKNIKNKSTM